MVNISLVTSLYRASDHLDTFTHLAHQLVAELQAAGLSLEIIVIANDPTEKEQQQIRALAAALDSIPTVQLVVQTVPRETIYASWNRGFGAARGLCIGPWNVDDQRTAPALIEGYHLIAEGCHLVYFPYTVVQFHAVRGIFTFKERGHYQALPFDRETFARAMRGASFWLCHRDLYARAGPFDSHFHIAGDFEWVTRALTLTEFCPGTKPAGEFHLHGHNLSDTGNPLQNVEENIVHLRQGTWDWLVPAEPDMMRACWMEWGDPGISLPDPIQDQLWGPEASEQWHSWQRSRYQARRRKLRSKMLRSIPRWIVNRTGLRPYLARWGIVKSAAAD
jgi:hypothetical protein